jgi:hypothetical protein
VIPLRKAALTRLYQPFDARGPDQKPDADDCKDEQQGDAV